MKLKQQPADFIVEEIPNIVISSEKDEHSIFLLEKQGVDTFDAIRQIAKKLRISLFEIGYAGLKDKHALARQYISIPTHYNVQGLNVDSLTLTFIGYHRKKIKIGDLTGNRFTMYLTKEEEHILHGEQGEVVERMFRLIVQLGDIYGADKMIPVGSVQVAGVSYKSIADPGTEFLEDLAAKGAKVKVLTFLNPAGMDLENWEKLKFPKDFATNQLRIMDAFKSMGIIITATCTPYLAGNLPRFREHIAWSESSAISFSNSVIGARTNREGGPSALAAAICGRTPNYGFHLWENRQPTIKIKVDTDLTFDSDFGALGYHVGKQIKNKIPYFVGIKNADTDQLKALGAAMAASGAVALYHVEGLTPEADLVKKDNLETITITKKEVDEAYAKLNTGKEPDIVILGCPHASLREISSVAEKLKGKHLKKPVWVCTSRMMKEAADRMGFTEIINRAGGHIVADTCMVVSPIEDMGYKTTGVNSGKAANYLPGFCKQNVCFASMNNLLEAVL